MDRLKYLGQSLLLPILGSLIFSFIFLIQSLFFSSVVVTVWLESSQQEMVSIEGNLKKPGFTASVTQLSETSEQDPDTCSENSFRVKVSGGRDLNNDALMGAIRGEEKEYPEICSGPMFEMGAPQSTTATDWRYLGLF